MVGGPDTVKGGIPFPVPRLFRGSQEQARKRARTHTPTHTRTAKGVQRERFTAFGCGTGFCRSHVIFCCVTVFYLLLEFHVSLFGILVSRSSEFQCLRLTEHLGGKPWKCYSQTPVPLPTPRPQRVLSAPTETACTSCPGDCWAAGLSPLHVT